MGKRDDQIKNTKLYLSDLEDKTNKWINPKPYFGSVQINFDDEQPKIMSAEEILESLRAKQSALVWTVDDVMAGIKKGIEETHKPYKPLVDELENMKTGERVLPQIGRNDLATVAKYFLNLIIKKP